MQRRLDWAREGADWPLRDHSRFVEAAGLRWHVQHFARSDAGASDAAASGPAPVPHTPPPARVLLIHGTGASTHTWRGLLPFLQPQAECLSMDLPGHAFTSLPAAGMASRQLSLPGMAQALGELLATLDFSPDLIVGHSAGAAIGVRLVLDGVAAPRLVASLNGALLPLGGLAGQVFSPAARLMALLPGVPRLFAWRATDAQVLQRLLDSTGSRLDATGQQLYGRLVANPGHVEGALGMMAGWDLPAFARDLPHLRAPLALLVGDLDATVPPGEADRLLQRMDPGAPAWKQVLPGLGHLAHEEQPEVVAQALWQAWDRAAARA